MKKKTMSYVMSGALSITILSAVSSSPAFGASPQLAREQAALSVTRTGTGTKNFTDVLAEQAAALGLSIDGDDIETAAKKVRLAKLSNQAAALGIDPTDKKEKVLRLEVKKAHEAEVYKWAHKLNIQTKGRRLKEIISAISRKNAQAAAQLHGFY